jgi:long-chain-fatty-acid--CoA ligase ACSBG
MSYIRPANNFRTHKINEAVKITRDEGDFDLVTIPDLFDQIVENYAENPALAYLDQGTKKWIFISYREYKARVDKYAKVFIKLGLKRFGSVAVLAFNSVEWFVTELATIHAG